MILKYLRLRKRAAKDASGNSTTPRTGTLDLVNRNDRPFVRNASNDEAGLLAEAGTPVDSIARVDTLTFAATGVVDGEKIAYGDDHFEFNASDGETPSNAGATPVKAQGEIALNANPADGGTMNIGTNASGASFVYTFRTTPSTARDIKIGDTVAETVDHIITAINGADGLYNTVANNSVTAANGTTTSVIVTAKYNGSTGDAVEFTESSTNLAMDGSNTLGGTRAGVDPQYKPIDITATADKSVGTLTFIGALTVDDQVRVGATTYTGVANADTPVAGEFRIGAGSAGAITNIIAAVNGTDGINTANASATLAAGAGATLVATAKVGGVAGDAIVSTDPTDVANKMSWGGATLASGADTTQSEAVTAVALAMNNTVSNVTNFSAVDGAGDTVVVTHNLHGTIPNGYGFADTDTDSDISSAETTAGVAGTEGIAGAQYEDDDYLYTCTSVTAANDAYTWKKSPLVGLTAEAFGSTTSAGDSLAIPVTHRIVQKTTGGDAEALTIVDGVAGQKLTIILTTDGGGDGTLTVGTNSTGTGWATCVFADAKDTLNLEYVNDTVGWIITGSIGVAAPPVIT